MNRCCSCPQNDKFAVQFAVSIAILNIAVLKHHWHYIPVVNFYKFTLCFAELCCRNPLGHTPVN